MHSTANPIFKIHMVEKHQTCLKVIKILSLAFLIYFLFYSLGYISEAASNPSEISRAQNVLKMNIPLQFLAASTWGLKRKALTVVIVAITLTESAELDLSLSKFQLFIFPLFSSAEKQKELGKKTQPFHVCARMQPMSRRVCFWTLTAITAGWANGSL